MKSLVHAALAGVTALCLTACGGSDESPDATASTGVSVATGTGNPFGSVTSTADPSASASVSATSTSEPTDAPSSTLTAGPTEGPTEQLKAVPVQDYPMKIGTWQRSPNVDDTLSQLGVSYSKGEFDTIEVRLGQSQFYWAGEDLEHPVEVTAGVCGSRYGVSPACSLWSAQGVVTLSTYGFTEAELKAFAEEFTAALGTEPRTEFVEPATPSALPSEGPGKTLKKVNMAAMPARVDDWNLSGSVREMLGDKYVGYTRGNTSITVSFDRGGNFELTDDSLKVQRTELSVGTCGTSSTSTFLTTCILRTPDGVLSVIGNKNDGTPVEVLLPFARDLVKQLGTT